ncbi:MAG: hypothetical protein JNJ56_07525 [Ignavibacteria bacterium]|nr:hypothetical protein [Ignavibacteria bacterium]
MSDNIKNSDDMTPSDGEAPLNNQGKDEKSADNPYNSGKKEESIIPGQENQETSNKSEDSETEKPQVQDKEVSATEIPEETVSAAIPLLTEEKEKFTAEPLKKSLPKDSNYQISLINQNLLKVNVTTSRGVKINSCVRNRNTSAETQDNEIYLYPRTDGILQEIEVLISIDESEDEAVKAGDIQTEETELKIKSGISESEMQNQIPESLKEKEDTIPEKSNYQINLINENLLKVRIETKQGIRIESISREKRTSAETQANRIYLHPVSEKEIQTVDITIEIDTEKREITLKDEEGNVKLIPNPEVVDLIQPPTYPAFDYADGMLIPEEGYKNPFDALRKLIQRNTTIGIIAAVVIHLIAAGIVYYNFSKKAKDLTPEERSRLIVIQDLPDPKIKLEDVEDPNKPKVPPPGENQPEVNEPKKEVKPRKIVKPPEVNRPNREENKKDTLSEADLTRELDSLRKLAEGISVDSLKDTTKTDTSAFGYDIPDSLRNTFNEGDIGLAMYFPKNWKLTDQREINKNEKEFKGVLLTDTTAEQTGTMTFFIYLDPEKKDFNTEDFKTEFPMNDSTLTAFLKEPKTLAGFTEYRFYIFNKIGTEKLSLRASVRKQFFDKYKNEIEAVVKSIRISKPEPLKKDSLQ